MRQEDVKITLRIPILKGPDANGIMYTKEAVEKAIKEADATLPLLNDGGKVIGLVEDMKIIDKEIVVDGIVFGAGTNDNVIRYKDILSKSNKFVEEYEITAVGFGE